MLQSIFTVCNNYHVLTDVPINTLSHFYDGSLSDIEQTIAILHS